jgi:hypothetical protein
MFIRGTGGISADHSCTLPMLALVCPEWSS